MTAHSHKDTQLPALPTPTGRDIIYLCEGFIDDRDLARFGFHDWPQFDLQLQGWELWPILFSQHPQPERQHEQNRDSRIFRLNSLASLRACIAKFPAAVYMLMFGLASPAGWAVFSILQELGCASAIIQLGATPEPDYTGTHASSGQRNIAKRIASKLPLLARPHDLVNYAKNHYHERRTKSAKPTYILIGGTEDEHRSQHLYDLTNSRLVFAHGMDYDLWMKNPSAELPADMPAGEYGVFLDTYEPHHPDNPSYGIEPICADTYYAHISSFMQRLERDLGMPIVVAAHPRSQYAPNDPRFAGRPVIRHATAALVRQASYVFGHHTTSYSFAVLARIPIILITTRAQLQIPFLAASIRGFERALQTRAYVVDELDAATVLSRSDLLGSVREDVYDSYRDRYLRHPASAHVPLGRIVADAFFGGDDCDNA